MENLRYIASKMGVSSTVSTTTEIRNGIADLEKMVSLLEAKLETSVKALSSEIKEKTTDIYLPITKKSFDSLIAELEVVRNEYQETKSELGRVNSEISKLKEVTQNMTIEIRQLFHEITEIKATETISTTTLPLTTTSLNMETTQDRSTSTRSPREISSHSLVITIDTSQAPEMKNFGDQVKSKLTEWYPKISTLLMSPNFDAPKNINIVFDPNLVTSATYRIGTTVEANANYYKEHPNDIGSLIYAMTCVIQHYPYSCPTWLATGIADWVRFYHYEPNKKPEKPAASNSYEDGFKITAYFLQYIIDVSNISPNMIYWANKDCREGKYADTLWPRLTRKTLEQHWAKMIQDH